jgi:hypothetical protein
MDDSPAGPTTPQIEPMAIIALIAALLAYPSSCCFSCFSIAFDVVAILVGILAYQQIMADPERLKGKELAIAGAVLGGVHALMIFGVFFIYFVVMVVAGVSGGLN